VKVTCAEDGARSNRVHAQAAVLGGVVKVTCAEDGARSNRVHAQAAVPGSV